MLITRPVRLEDCDKLHRLYCLSPRYFEIISMPVPLENDVQRELETALADPRRELLFLYPGDAPALLPPGSTELASPVGYLDVKHDYPTAGDCTINLLLIAEPYQSLGYGARAVRYLEEKTRRQGRTGRLLAGVYGHNPRAVRFWERLGYHYAVDARPVLEWYAKDLHATTRLDSDGLGLAAAG
ncbi:MAG TPA: GNAT family N-acetyltransferase [Deinococcales bacterium]|nr:GNAT family N-acetyltransferase [Deinococcales bacterium]